ncbi:hypothetical protein DM01DRAFT_1338048, partial [Hesseltinella vesiculosa]
MEAVALFDCLADEEGELSFTEGTQFINVVESPEYGWLEGTIETTLQRGLFPANYVRLITVASPKLSAVTSLPTSASISSTWSLVSNIPDKHDDHTTPNQHTIPSASAAPSLVSATPVSSIPTSRPTIPADAPSSKPPVPASSTSSTLLHHRSQLKPVPSTAAQSTTSVVAMPMPTAAAAVSKDTKSADVNFVLPVLRSVMLKDTSASPSLTASPFSAVAASPTSSSKTTPLSSCQTSPARPSPLEETEEEDGYQLVKPSDIRKRQQQSSAPASPALTPNSKSPPMLKPKPAGLQQRSHRSLSNPPPKQTVDTAIQARPVATTSPLAGSTNTNVITKTKKQPPPPPPSLPVSTTLPLSKKPSAPVLPSQTRGSPSADQDTTPLSPSAHTAAVPWKQPVDDTNLKPSQLFLRQRSSTNPSSMTTPALSARPAAIRVPPPPPTSTCLPVSSNGLGNAAKKAPPPPPPSRKTRYDDLF